MPFEKLRVYQAALELRAEIDKLKKHLNPRFAWAFQHVEGAADSILFNIAEGSGSIYPAKRANFFDTAIGSSKEVRSGVKSIDKLGGFNGASIFRPVVLTLSVGKMLTAMIKKLV